MWYVTHLLFALAAGNQATNAPFHDTSQVQSVCDHYIWCNIKSFPPDKGLQSPGHEFLSWCCSACDWWPWRFACILSNYSESNCWKYPPHLLPLHSPLSVFFVSAGAQEYDLGCLAFCVRVRVTHQEPSGQMAKTADVANRLLQSADIMWAPASFRKSFSHWRIKQNSLVNSSKPGTKPTSLVTNHNILCK